MPFGYNGKIAKIDLTKRKIEIDTPDEKWYRTYMGGSNFGAYYMLKEMKPKADPLSPDNIMVISTSVITGVPSPGFSRFAVSAKSPLTGCFGDAQAGGFLGPELKFAGYDALVIKGKAIKPSYIFIKDGNIEIKDASMLWGQNLKETQEQIRKENNDDKIQIIGIGIAGENLVKFANLITGLHDAAGRNGLGAVMGSKNLKAVAVRGTTDIQIKDVDVIKSLNKYYRDNVKDNPATRDLHKLGTANYVMAQNLDGHLPTRNFQTGYFEEAEAISGETLISTVQVKTEGCWSCPVKCKRVVRTKGKYSTDPSYGGPEYETLASLGSNCGVSDLNAVCYGNQLCNSYSLDTISTGAAIAFAMECFENGILTKQDTDGLELKFGNADAMVEMINKIAMRQGLGNILADGVKIAAQKIGKGSEKYALEVKGQELPMHDPRVKGLVGFNYAFAPNGADHVVAEHDTDFDFKAPEIFLEQAKSLGILERLETGSIDEKKIRMWCYLQDHFSFCDVLGICVLAFGPVRVFRMSDCTAILSAVTGWEASFWEIMKAGERRFALGRVFNAREGIVAKDDYLPERMYEPIKSGPRKGSVVEKERFREATKLVYRMRNWDEQGIPTKALLWELDLGWVVENLESYGVKLSL